MSTARGKTLRNALRSRLSGKVAQTERGKVTNTLGRNVVLYQLADGPYRATKGFEPLR